MTAYPQNVFYEFTTSTVAVYDALRKKCSYSELPGPHFSAFTLDTERYVFVFGVILVRILPYLD